MRFALLFSLTLLVPLWANADTTIATEDFASANNPLSNSADWTQAGAGIAGAGLAAGGVFEAGTTAGSGGGSYWATDSFNADQYGVSVINGSPDGGTNWGIILRAADSDPDELLLALFLGGSDEVECYYINASGTPIQVGSTTAMTDTPALTDSLRAEIVGVNLKILFDFGAGMVEQLSCDMTASGITAGAVGLMIQDPTGTGNFDDWEGGNMDAAASGTAVQRRRHIQ